MNELREWYLNSPFSTATWKDVVDVALLALAIDGLLGVLRGTRALQSLVGLGLPGGGLRDGQAGGSGKCDLGAGQPVCLCRAGHVDRVQEDVRRVLARAGDTLFVASGNAAEAAALEEVVRAVFALASKRIGALIALERTARLDAYLQGGHAIDGVLSAEVLQALFHPTSPVHDGAVVLRSDRIVSAAVFLPISLSKGLPKVYGTRHRAAIG